MVRISTSINYVMTGDLYITNNKSMWRLSHIQSDIVAQFRARILSQELSVVRMNRVDLNPISTGLLWMPGRKIKIW